MSVLRSALSTTPESRFPRVGDTASRLRHDAVRGQLANGSPLTGRRRILVGLIRSEDIGRGGAVTVERGGWQDRRGHGGAVPESFAFGDGIDWSSPLVETRLYVELPFWLMTSAGRVDVEWSGTTFGVDVCSAWMEVFGGQVLDSRASVVHHGPWRPDGWEPPDEIAAELARLQMTWLQRPCKTVSRTKIGSGTLTCSFADRSRGFVLVDEAAEDGSSLDGLAGEVGGRGGHQWVGVRRPLPEALVRSVRVVVDCVLGQDSAEMSLSEDHDSVQEFAA